MTAGTPRLPATFDLAGPRPSGTTVLGASSGTGKTYAVAGLVTRWVAETSLRLPQLLVVTFTRAATGELRDRVRRRLVTAADHLDSVLAGRTAGMAAETHDPVLERLTAADPDELARRRGRLTRALGDIDVATISTIHGFCQHILDGLGIASDLDRDAELVEDLHDLVEEVVDDLLIETYLDPPDDLPTVSRHDLAAIGRAVIDNPTTLLAPHRTEDPVARLRLRLAARIRAEVARRARRRRRLSYDDLLTLLDGLLRDAARGQAAREVLRQRYQVVLVDEFQDTDPVQWSIFARAFADDPGDEPGRALVLIGDPKQAIYAFRGADVYAYLDAADTAATRATLGTNWRADAGLLQALDALFDGATFGDPAIAYHHVDHAPGHDAVELAGAPRPAPLRLRLVPRHPALGLGKSKQPFADRVRDLIARDVAADIVALLNAQHDEGPVDGPPQQRRGAPSTGSSRHPSQPPVTVRAQDGAGGDTEPLAPRHLAVLVRNNAQAAQVQEALHAVGVPAVLGGGDSVFTTPAAGDWRRLLEALERPAATTKVRALALTAWIGWTGDDLAAKTERDWDELHDDLYGWADLLRDRGVAVTHRAVLLQRQVRPRLLARRGGERLLADLDHIGELLHAAASAEHLGVTGLSSWLHGRIADAADDQQDERLRRLETDDEAVQVLTIHRSKGLEFPVVYCPYLWSSNTGVGNVPVFHAEDRRRRLDVGGKDHPDFDDSKARAEEEARGEELRLAYVAMTRAKHQVITWYAPAGQPGWSGLGRLLLCRTADGRADCEREAPLPDDDEALAAAHAIADRADGAIAVETVPAEPSAIGWAPPRDPVAGLDRARFARTLDVAWRRTSYSALTRLDEPAPRVGSEAVEAVTDDEELAEAAVDTIAPVGDPDGLRDVALPLADMPAGAHVGTFVHRILEAADFAAEDLDAELWRVLEDEKRWRPPDIDATAVAAGLRAVIDTPLGPHAGDITLRAVTRADRRDEVAFELPLDRAHGRRAPTVADVAELLRAHLPADDPLANYPDQLAGPLLRRELRGFLGGSIDLLVRRRDGDGPGVFHVIDHKTNRLGTWGEPLTAWDYRPAALPAAMTRGHYPIQALLYTVAVHRMLRWRLADYDPDRHLGSVLYLFLRGMAGAVTPAPGGQPCGVFAWNLPAKLVTATSDLLHGVST